MSDDDQEMDYDDQDLIDELEQNLSTNLINNDENTSDEQKPLRKRAQKGLNRHPRQKFCARWQLEFPWLRPNKVNESVGYCNICRRELVCKKSHLERHQRSYKHMRLQGFESVYTVNEPEAELIEAHTSGYLDDVNDHDYQIEEVLDEFDDEQTTIKVEPTRASSVNSPVLDTKHDLKQRTKNMKMKANHRQTHSPKTYSRNESMKQSSHAHYFDQEFGSPEYTPMYASPPKKDSFDLFFESISASVKNLPPKLAAEIKSKISQVITEFELRAICEKEAEERAKSSTENGTSQITNMITIDPNINSGTNIEQTIEEGVTHYVYTYQPKMQ